MRVETKTAREFLVTFSEDEIGSLVKVADWLRFAPGELGTHSQKVVEMVRQIREMK